MIRIYVAKREVRGSGDGKPIVIQDTDAPDQQGHLTMLGRGRHEIAPGVWAVYDPEGFDFGPQATRVWIELTDE